MARSSVVAVRFEQSDPMWAQLEHPEASAEILAGAQCVEAVNGLIEDGEHVTNPQVASTLRRGLEVIMLKRGSRPIPQDVRVWIVHHFNSFQQGLGLNVIQVLNRRSQLQDRWNATR